MSLKVNLEKKDDGTVILSPVGSIDTDTYQEFEKKLGEASGITARGVIINMSKTTYISSIGFGVLVRAKQELEEKAMTLAIIELSPDVKRIFEAVKLIPDSLFASLKQADEYLDQFIEFMHKKKDDKCY